MTRLVNDTRKARIFVVEDDLVLTKILVWRLEKLGYSVCGTSADGKGAIEEILEKKPDLVLLDIELGGQIDGIEIGSYLCNNTGIPFIYLTSHTDGIYIARAKETVPEGYILKPCEDEQLRIAIQMAIHE